MINYELRSTEENIKNALLNNTSGRNKGIANFIKTLEMVDKNAVIALDDSWGNGKTFFVKQLQMILQNYNLSTDDANKITQCIKPYLEGYHSLNYIPIYYDAWCNDSDDDPVLSMVYNMLQEIEELKDSELTDTDWHKKIVAALELVVTTFSGVKIKDFVESISGSDPLTVIKKHKNSDQILNQLFDAILSKHSENQKILFIIDELDRCRPDYAVKLLERIKHYFLHDRVIFILSTNMRELQHTIKRYYGNELDATKYLTRFYDFTIALPPPDMNAYYSTLNFLSNSRARDYIAKNVIEIYNFSMRDISRYLQFLRSADPNRYSEYDNRFGFYMEVIIPFLFGLKIHSIDKYEDFMQGRDFGEFVRFFQKNNADRYCRILLKENETFNDNDNITDKVIVPFEKRFELFYNCIFGFKTSYNGIPLEERIGMGTFSSTDKKIFLDIMSFEVASRNSQGEK